MLRLFWVVVLLVSARACEHGPQRDNTQSFFEALAKDLNIIMRQSLDGSLHPSSESSSYRPSSTEKPESSTYHVPPSPEESGYRPSSTEKPESSTYHVPSPSSDYPVSHSTEDSSDCEQYDSHTSQSSHGHAVHVGSVRGVPGINFPDYTDIPLTSFTCSDKDYIPGFYADLEAGCQVFHVCWPHRRESFLCPVGTIFNQALLACDYWYSSNCSLAPHYYNVNVYSVKSEHYGESKVTSTGSMINVLLDTEKAVAPSEQSKDSLKVAFSNPDSVLSFVSQFLPVKAKVTVYPETKDTRSKIVATASVGATKQKEEYLMKHPTVSVNKPRHTSKAKISPKSKPKVQTYEATAQKYQTSEESLIRILEEVSKTVRSIIEEARGVLAAHKVHKHHYSKKPYPLTKLNPKFITKPVQVFEDKSPNSSTYSSTQETKTSTMQSSIADSKKPVVSESQRHSQVKVSPMTKQALTKNYLRLLKIKTV